MKKNKIKKLPAAPQERLFGIGSNKDNWVAQGSALSLKTGGSSFTGFWKREKKKNNGKKTNVELVTFLKVVFFQFVVFFFCALFFEFS